MSINYRSVSNGEMSNYKRVFIQQIDLSHLECEVIEKGRNKFKVSMFASAGLFFPYPKSGEEWLVQQIGSQWFLVGRTTFQNEALAMLQAASPGDLVLNASGNIIVGSPIIQANRTNRWIKDNSSVANNTADVEVGALTISGTDLDIADVVNTGRLKLVKAGTYAINFSVTVDGGFPTGRAYLYLHTVSNSFLRRAFFTNEDQGFLETTLPLAKDDILVFKIFHVFGSTKTFDVKIDITEVR